MNARLAIGLGATAALVLLVALLSREPAPSSSAATPAASAAERQVRPAPAVEQPEEVLVVEPQVQPPSEPQLASPPPSDATPREVDPLERDEGERLPEGWTPPPEEFGSVTVLASRSTSNAEPLEGVLVWLVPVDVLGNEAMVEPRFSDADGRVTFEHVPTGVVQVGTRPHGSHPKVSVTRGERSTASVSIGGWLRAVEGVARTRDGRPAEGAEICDVANYLGAPRAGPRAVSNASGEFRLWVNGSGEVQLVARRADALPSKIVSVPPNPDGRCERVDFVLGSEGQRLEVLVVAPNRRPIENARVWLSIDMRASPDLPEWAGHEVAIRNSISVWRSVSDSRGIATFGSLPRGVLDLDATADGYIAAGFQVRLPHPDDSAQGLEVDPEARTVTEGRIELMLDEGVTLEGRVVLADGRAAARAVVWHHEGGADFHVSTRADELGYFRLHGVPTRSCGVEARLSDYATGAVLPAVADGTTRWWAPVLQHDGR